MKSLMILATLLFSLAIKADVVFFECKAPKIDGVHLFEAKGVAVVDDMNQIDGTITLKTIKASEDDSVQIFEQLSVSGYLRHYNSGGNPKKEFDQLILKVNNNYIKGINIVLDSELPLVSNVLSIDNFLYRSDCNPTME